MNCYVSKVRLFNVSFVYSVPLSLQVVLFGRKEENIVEMYILGNVEKKKKKMFKTFTPALYKRKVVFGFSVPSIMADTRIKTSLAAILYPFYEVH